MAFSFGATPATTTPSFSGFGTTPSLSTGLGGLGTFSTFGGATTSSGTTGFGGFGVPSVSGATTTAAPSLFGGFGTTKTTTASPFNFSTPAAASTGTGTGLTGFGGMGTGFGTGTSTVGGTSTGFGGFATGATGATSLFGNAAAGTNTLGGGTGNTLFGGATQQPNALQQQETNLANFAMAVSLPQIYGDERDAIIAKWNQLQAYWGAGKGFFSSNGMVDFKPDNHFCRFKALGYHLIPKGNNELGQLVLVLSRKESDVIAAQQQITDTLHRILGTKPTLSVCVEGIKPLPEDRTEVVIYVLERPATGPAKRITANDLFNFLNHPTQKTQLSSQLNVVNMLPKIGWTEEILKEYLEKPPSGIDPLLWQQAKLDNPDPEKYIPVPMVGFKELQHRLRYQAEQTKLYQQSLDVLSGDLTDLQTQHSTMLLKLESYKEKNLELGHRLLKMIVRQEIYRKMGYAIQVDEETLKVQLEQLQVELNHPTQFKGRLNELMSQMRMQLQMASVRSDPTYQMDSDTQAEIKQMLKQQQEGIQHLINIIKEDSSNLQLIEQGIAKPHNNA